MLIDSILKEEVKKLVYDLSNNSSSWRTDIHSVSKNGLVIWAGSGFTDLNINNMYPSLLEKYIIYKACLKCRINKSLEVQND